MEIRVNRFEGHEDVLSALAARLQSPESVDEFCTYICESMRHIVDIDTLILFTVKDPEILEMVASHGKPYARLDEGKFLKRNRRTPVTDAIRLRKAQVWSDMRKMVLEYPDIVEWPRIMHAVVAIPIIKNEIAVAGCVYVLRREFPSRDNVIVREILEKLSELIYSKFQG